MKGITNAQLREKLEIIEIEIKSIKEIQQQPSILPVLLGIFSIIAIVSTTMMILFTHPLLIFFTTLGICQMMFLIFYILYEKRKK